MGSAAAFVGRLFVAAPSQVWFVLVVATIAAVAYFGFQDEVGKRVGYSAAPLGLWLVVVLFLAVFLRSVLSSQWRLVVASMALALSISGGLGIFYAPLGSFSGETYGGDVGMAISRSPLEWDRFDVTLTQYTAAWLRVLVLAFIAFTVFSPNRSKSTGIGIFRGLGAGYVLLATGTHLLFRRFETWRYERAQVKALRNADRAAYEADQAAQQAEVARKAAAVTPETVSSTDVAVNPVTSSTNGESAVGIGSGDTNSEPTKMVERLPGSPAPNHGGSRR